MRAPADDEPMPGFDVPGSDLPDGGSREDPAVIDRDLWAARAGAHPGTRRRRRAAAVAIESGEPHDPDRRRYFLSSVQPSGDYEAVIVAISDGARRRYFSSRDGSHFIEVDELSFEQRRKSGTRSMLEIDEHELGELEGELIFVRPLGGRDPIAEVAAATKASLEATRPLAIVSAMAASTEAPAAAPVMPSATDAAAMPMPGADASEGDVGSDIADDDGADEVATGEARPDGDDDAAGPDAHGPRRATFEPVSPTRIVEAPATEPEPEPEPAPVQERAPEVTADAAEAVSEPEDGGPEVEFEFEFERSFMSDSEPVLEAEAGTEPDSPPEPVASAAASVAPVAATPRAPASLTALDAVSQVALAKGIAFAAHRGQLDKSGTPYIDHPGRIAERFDPVTDPIAAAAAWLHDVLEDTPLTSRELFEAGVLLEIVAVVELLTRRPEVEPDEYYARIRLHPVALRVKLADIDDNTAPWRLRRLDDAKQRRLVEKYRYARRALGVV